MWLALFEEIFRISSFAEHEFIYLVAHYNDALSGERNRVSPAVKSRGYTAEQLAHTKKRIADRFNPIESCGLKFTKPFGHLKYDSLNYVLTLFENYERGCLPFPGSVSQQPAQIMEIFGVLSRLKQEAETKTRETTNPHGRNQYKDKSRASR